MFFRDFQSFIVLFLARVGVHWRSPRQAHLFSVLSPILFLWVVCQAVVEDCREIGLFSLSFQTTRWLYSRELFLSFIVPCTWMPAWISSDYFESLLLPQWSLNRPAANAVHWRHQLRQPIKITTRISGSDDVTGRHYRPVDSDVAERRKRLEAIGWNSGYVDASAYAEFMKRQR